MLGEFGTLIGSIALALVGVAIVSVIVAPQAHTADVIQAAASGFAQDIHEAVSPVTGNSNVTNTGYNPSSFSPGGLHL